MGISVEQSGSRIGSYNNFIKTKDALWRCMDRFWNVMLMMFYMNVFYFNTNIETSCWTIQIME